MKCVRLGNEYSPRNEHQLNLLAEVCNLADSENSFKNMSTKATGMGKIFCYFCSLSSVIILKVDSARSAVYCKNSCFQVAAYWVFGKNSDAKGSNLC